MRGFIHDAEATASACACAHVHHQLWLEMQVLRPWKLRCSTKSPTIRARARAESQQGEEEAIVPHVSGLGAPALGQVKGVFPRLTAPAAISAMTAALAAASATEGRGTPFRVRIAHIFASRNCCCLTMAVMAEKRTAAHWTR